ncbi:tRNA dimethylallyltransferase [Hamiltosporidium magnivora]|uniref:tRNA dimethylallyltransferase n=1 Tax=Hamiltosporidium magnivora TaxID=148818 RepID=A0A4Q9LCV5_9MICR|nr:tRNA dimethylallyltransferase [Hamiltosporidium magnivora]
MFIIAGCTGIGKTEIANLLSKKYSLLLISCDSIQIYKDMNIGSNKGTSNTNHSLIDISCWKERFNLYKFEQKLLEILIENKDNKIPCIVGGTGLYLINIQSEYKIEYVNNKRYINTMESKDISNRYINTMDSNDISNRYINTMESNDINNNRSINTMESNDISKSKYIDNKNNEYINDKESKDISNNNYISNEFNYLGNKIIKCNFKFFLTTKREILYRKVDKRCEEMILNGFLYEIITLYFEGLNDNYISGRSIGYRDGLDFINKLYQRIKEHSFDKSEIFQDLGYFVENFKEFLEIFKRKTRNYIARQECWYKNRGYIWIDCSKYNAYDIISKCIEYLTVKNLNFNEIDCFLKDIHMNSIEVNKNSFKLLKRYNSNNECFNNNFNFDKFIKDLIEKLINFNK